MDLFHKIEVDLMLPVTFLNVARYLSVSLRSSAALTKTSAKREFNFVLPPGVKARWFFPKVYEVRNGRLDAHRNP